MKRYTFQSAVVVSLVCVLLTGCAAERQTGQQIKSPKSHAELGPSTIKLQNLFPNFSADYIPTDTPTDLEKMSQITVLGQVEEYTAGRAWQFRDVGDGSYQSTFAKIRITKIFKESASQPIHEVVWVEINQNLSKQPFDYSGYIPLGTEFLLFLEPAQIDSSQNIIYLDSSNAWTSQISGPLYRFVSPQAWAISVPKDHTVVWPLAQDAVRGSLSDFEP
ncbi:MAG: hypothetical protein RL508_724 [Actinomycetota bacterium]|jgi:hypothetical protein